MHVSKYALYAPKHPERAPPAHFPDCISSTTPAHPSTDFKWKDYCPRVFRRLRASAGIDEADYMLSLAGAWGVLGLGTRPGWDALHQNSCQTGRVVAAGAGTLGMQDSRPSSTDCLSTHVACTTVASADSACHVCMVSAAQCLMPCCCTAAAMCCCCRYHCVSVCVCAGSQALRQLNSPGKSGSMFLLSGERS